MAIDTKTSVFKVALIVITLAAAVPFLAAVEMVSAREDSRLQTVTIRVTDMGFEPARVTIKRGIPVRVRVLRTTDKTCATEIVFPDYGVRRTLPLNEWVTINFTPTRSGEFSFTCGMGMQRGTLIVRQ